MIFDVANARVFVEYIGARYAGLAKKVGADSNADWACSIPAVQAEYQENRSEDPFAMLPPLT